MAPLNDWPWRHWARTQPQVTALMLGEQPLSWLALQSQVDELAADFQHQGVEPGCGVALCGKTAIHCCWPIWRCCSAAHVCCRSIPPCRRRCWRSCCQVDMTFVFGPDSLPPLPEEVIRLTPPSTEPRWPDLPTWDAQRLATLTLTSGSSGMPKAAAHSYANHLASAAGVLELMAFQREDCWLLSLPLFHVSGQGHCLALAGGGRPVGGARDAPAERGVGGMHACLVGADPAVAAAGATAGGHDAEGGAARRRDDPGGTDRAGGGGGDPLLVRLRLDRTGFHGVRQARRCAAGRWPAARRPRIKLVDEEVWIAPRAWRSATGVMGICSRWPMNRAGLRPAIAARWPRGTAYSRPVGKPVLQRR